MENNNVNSDSIAKVEESPESCNLDSEHNQQSPTETTLSKRQLKKIRKKEKWLKLKPEKRYSKFKIMI